MTGSPAVSVVMPVYNGGAYLAEAIQCILDQTYTDFEFIIIDDGSTDGSVAVIRTFTDPRIKLITQANKGLAATLNIGIAHARGKWIARQDHDDVSLPERFAKQIAFLTANPDVGLLGSWATITDTLGKPIGAHEHPTHDDVIRFELLFDSPFVHASVMMTRAVVDKVVGYDTDPKVFEDFDMWSRMMRHTHGANLPEHLVRYREVSTSIMRTTTVRMDRILAQRRRNLRSAFPDADDHMIMAMCEFGLRHGFISVRHYFAVRAAFAAYIQRNATAVGRALQLNTRVRRTMPGYRIIAHRSFMHRVADRLLKEVLLLCSDLLTIGTRRRLAAKGDLRRQ